jgi:hypothetical protein
MKEPLLWTCWAILCYVLWQIRCRLDEIEYCQKDIIKHLSEENSSLRDLLKEDLNKRNLFMNTKL